MLGFYNALGRRLQAYRALLWGLVMFAVVVFLAAIMWPEPTDDQTYTLGAIVLLLWALSLVAVGQTFAAPTPDIDPAARILDRVKVRLARGFRWLMAITTTGLFGFVILLSFKSLGLLLRS